MAIFPQIINIEFPVRPSGKLESPNIRFSPDIEPDLSLELSIYASSRASKFVIKGKEYVKVEDECKDVEDKIKRCIEYRLK